MNVLITGAAGYIGAMLTERLAQSDNIDAIFGIDLKAQPARFGESAKLRWLTADVSEDQWLEEIRGQHIDVVIHCAYQIREMYGSKRKQHEHWNIDGARKSSIWR